MELIDTHCHLTFDDLAGDIDAVIERSIAAGVTGWLTVGTDPDENRKAVITTIRCTRTKDVFLLSTSK